MFIHIREGSLLQVSLFLNLSLLKHKTVVYDRNSVVKDVREVFETLLISSGERVVCCLTFEDRATMTGVHWYVP